MKKTVKLISGLLMAAILVTMPITSQSKSSNESSVKKILLTNTNTIVLNDVIEGESVAEVINKAKSLDKTKGLKRFLPLKKDPIYVFLRTPGGEIQTGLEMLEALNGLNRPVDTITMFAASMGFQTAQQLGKRYIVQNGVLMSHRANGQVSGELGGQKPSQTDNRKGFWEQRIQEMDQRTVDRTNGKQTLASYQKSYVSELWLTGRQAVDQGYADEVVQIQCDESLSGFTTKSLRFGPITILYDVDNCPLNSTPMNIRVGQLGTNKGVMLMDEFTKQNGGFGSVCLVASGVDVTKVCAIDTSLTLERVNELKNQFKSYYLNIEDRSIALDAGYALNRIRM